MLYPGNPVSRYGHLMWFFVLFPLDLFSGEEIHLSLRVEAHIPLFLGMAYLPAPLQKQNTLSSDAPNDNLHTKTTQSIYVKSYLNCSFVD